MNWKKYWNSNANMHTNVIDQVQRNVKDDLTITTNHIIDKLKINANDVVLDVCCGNGLLTQLISEKCHSIVGIDQSDVLINQAISLNNSKKVSYNVASASTLTEHVSQKFDKIYLQFSFQYFDKNGEGATVISEMLALLKQNGSIFIGDIPNYEHKFDFYNTLKKKFYLFTSKLKGTNPMGKFWKQRELDAICKKNNVKGTFLKQVSKLPYSHYRFDYLIQN